MGKITYQGIEFSYQEEDRKTILCLLQEQGLFVDAPCGGRHVCKKCKIRVVSGNVILNGMVSSLADTEILACESIPYGDIIVEPSGGFIPDILTSRPIEDMKGLMEISNAEVGLAVDIGTTSLVLYFHNLMSGSILSIQTALNPQRAMGADVMTRLQYAEENGQGLLQRVLADQINSLIRDTCEQVDFGEESIRRVVIAGNSIMEHFISGRDASGIGTAPYTPASLFGDDMSAQALGLAVNPEAKVYLCPCVSSFVGGDITAGMLYCGMDTLERNALLLDVGTNGEMVLKAGGLLYCCSAPAGPAFEGAHIECGMSGSTGAISQVFLQSGGDLGYETIHGTEASGICGSGLIDAIACLLKAGKLDRTGRLTDGTDRVLFSEKVWLTQKDIREVQLAKSAIHAGILTLCREAGISPDQIETVMLAGGFGAKINPRNAGAIGLIPAELSARAISIGNAAGCGASQILLRPLEKERAERLAKSCVEIDLAENAYFQEAYIEKMGF